MNISHTYSEKELLLQVASGNEDAFATLFNAWRDKLYFYILRITDSSQDAEDVVQEVFVKLWLIRKSLQDVEHFGSYLYRMAHNYAVTGIRRMARETIRVSELQANANADNPAADEILYQKQLHEKLKTIVTALPQQQRLVYTLSREQGLKQEDIAQQLHISISTVQNHMTQALRTIRKELGGGYSRTAIYLILAAIATKSS
ncbi:RNA polymerase sigma-70 factor [Chitinophagaceae bacterium 26-R-25]|nr:RNA polymerase sigma-70 factor [Chitinophagaceae bacterium 26-R-25]